MTNYIQDVVDRLNTELGTTENDPILIHMHALLVIATGQFATEEDVHDAWACWCNLTRPEHPDLIHFDHLTPENQARDTKYVIAIRNVARALTLIDPDD